LKRKDWLHEEALSEVGSRQSGVGSRESGVGSQESLYKEPEVSSENKRLLSFAEHTQFKTIELLKVVKPLTSLFSGAVKQNVDLNAPEYMTQVNELKASLISYAALHQHEELMIKAQALPVLKFDEYKNIFRADDFASVFTSLAGGLLKSITSLFNKRKLRELEKHLTNVESCLGSCILYLKAHN